MRSPARPDFHDVRPGWERRLAVIGRTACGELNAIHRIMTLKPHAGRRFGFAFLDDILKTHDIKRKRVFCRAFCPFDLNLISDLEIILSQTALHKFLNLSPVIKNLSPDKDMQKVNALSERGFGCYFTHCLPPHRPDTGRRFRQDRIQDADQHPLHRRI